MTMPPIDPVVSGWARLSLGLLFTLTAAHKLRSLGRFEVKLAAYDLLPAAAVPWVAIGVALLELTAALQVIAGYRVGALVLGGLLVLYSSAIGLNLKRGRTDIACGCGSAENVPLHPALLLRNLVLFGMTMLLICPSSGRAWTLVDSFTVVLASAVGATLFAGFDVAVVLDGRRRTLQAAA